MALDYTAAYEQGGGIGRYVRELVNALARVDQRQPYRLFVAGQRRTLPPLPGPNFSWKATRITPRWFARFQRLRLPLPVELFTGRLDLYHATDFVLPPALPATRTLLTVHDLSFVRVPETASPPLKAYLDVVVPRSVRRAFHVLADSEATKQDLIELYGTPPEKITVLLSGVDTRFQPISDAQQQIAVRHKYAIGPCPYIFSVGTIQPRKNYSRLIRALAQLRHEGHDLALVIAGGHGWLEGEMYQTLRETQMQEHVQLIGFADDDDLPALYSAAECLAFPSLYEGFGFPILEAMACGTPVLTSNVSSLPEVAGDAALLVDPYDLEAIIDALRRLITDSTLRTTLIQRGFQQAPRFTWESAARQLVGIYRDLLG
ncbi:MAG: glycosyltransferase family 4 protein [Chloroflexi bacterium]|nr:glycosyltransferase family 4 protein [Chloroflexota bacterium]